MGDLLILLTVTGSLVGIAVFTLVVNNRAEDRGVWKGEVNRDREAFHNFMDEIREKLEQIFERLPPRRLLDSESPLKLTEFGQEVSNQVKGKAWASEQAQKISDDLSDAGEYEIQERCLSHVWLQYENDDELKNIYRQCAYDNGVKVDQIVEVVSVELRDAVLSSRDGLA